MQLDDIRPKLGELSCVEEILAFHETICVLTGDVLARIVIARIGGEVRAYVRDYEQKKPRYERVTRAKAQGIIYREHQCNGSCYVNQNYLNGNRKGDEHGKDN